MNRNVIALNLLFDYSIGTLWRIREDLWKERIHDDEGYDSDRRWHPGLSIRKDRIVDSYEMVPMLHGTSKGSKRDAVVVRGVTSHGGEDKKTYFGRIFAPILISDFLYDQKRISKNKDKTRLNESEMVKLEKWMRRKGL